nr:Chain A, Major prion protein [Homo sapiens]4E1H_C Chain C, Major prion protein [Homo sapiens]4E1H_E Chain E, Major prion protein [Homo sapiens]4E1H_G Chain G, Major prion protein [Homo sapiens]4E1H_I Chain I, Major prion protein [Homo sapiens]4E1H_K Chain K, Major prion protein [Homo sapiens]4E1I_A Chain A, Major prion protein [Homo sapiens]4E1I_C Chain C, Major prion protein [Homo sapiens]4E1I_E Chain E, Major prion protein [Homo sapiens]4E1I_G Chain G, Major prion protein [Homo sapien
HDCVNI